MPVLELLLVLEALVLEALVLEALVLEALVLEALVLLPEPLALEATLLEATVLSEPPVPAVSSLQPPRWTAETAVRTEANPKNSLNLMTPLCLSLPL
jgi:hypothetical protein